VLWIDGNGTQIPPWLLGPDSNELLTAPGQYDLFAWGEDNPGGPGTARLAYRANEHVDGDRTLLLTAAATHTVTLDARDETGQVPSQTAVGGRLVLPPGSPARFLELPRITARTIEVDGLAAGFTLLLHESWYDRAGRKLYAVSHRPLAGVAADATLHAGGAELESIDASVYATAEPNRYVRLDVSSVVGEPGRNDAFDFAPAILLSSFVEAAGAVDPLQLRVFMSPDPDPRYRSIVQLTAAGSPRQTIAAPALRVIDGRIVAGSGSPALYSGDALILGRGVAFPRTRFNVQPALSKVVAQTFSVGAAGELRLTDAVSGRADVSLHTPGTQRVELITRGVLTPHLPRQSKTTFTLDASRSDFIPPVLTSLRLLGGDERLASRLEIGARGSLLFSAADYEYAFEATDYKPLAGEATRLRYRPHGAPTWSPLPLTRVLEDTGTPLRLGDGILYRADLASITAVPPPHQLVDLEIELTDTAGNTATYELESAFSIGPETLPKHRSAGK
jgi:hypothetical protein